jgi:hypothetical protein
MKISRTEFLKILMTFGLTGLFSGTVKAISTLSHTIANTILGNQANQKSISNSVGSQTFIVGNQADPQEFEKTLKLAKSIGMTSIRFDVLGWQFYSWDENTKATIPLTEGADLLTQQLNICRSLGLKPILNFSTYHDGIAETQFGQSAVGWPITQPARQAYVDWTVNTIRMINKNFPDLDFAAQLSNECAHNTEWKTHADAFFTTMKDAVNAIRASGAKCQILLASMGLGHVMEISPVEYAKRLKAEGLLKDATATFHNYAGNSADFWAPESMLGMANAVTKILGVPFMMTETGVHTWNRTIGTKNPDQEKIKSMLDMQGIYNIRYILLALGTGATNVTLYEIKDRLGNGQNFNTDPGIEQMHGIFYNDGTPKPGARDVQKFLNQYGSHTLVSYGPTKDNPRHFEAGLKDPDGRMTYLHWCVAPYDATSDFPMMPKPSAKPHATVARVMLRAPTL